MPKKRIADLRDQAQRLTLAARTEMDPVQRERLAQQAFELAQMAEKLERDERLD